MRGMDRRICFLGRSSAPCQVRAFLIVILPLSFALRVHDLEGKSLWSDEGLTLRRAEQPLGLVLENVNLIPLDPDYQEGSGPAEFAETPDLHPPLADAEIASRAHPADIRFGDSIRLVGFDLTPVKAYPEDEVSVTLCWEAIEPTLDNYAYFVHFLGPNETIVGARDTHPGLGRYPTSQWTAGVSFCDVVRVPVDKETPAPAVYDVEIGWYDPETKMRLPARTADGNPVELVTLGRIEVVSAEQPTVQIPNRVNARLGDHVVLLGYGIGGGESPIVAGQSIDVTLYWKTEAPLTQDFTVFLHLAPPSSSPQAQQDSQPRQGTYPTSYWEPGLMVIDIHTLELPEDLAAGRYPLITGMYGLDTGERLPAFAGTNERLTADAVPLKEVEVLP